MLFTEQEQKRLYEALQAYEQAMLDKLPPEDEIDLTFSDSFTRRMQKMVSRVRRGWRGERHGFAKKVTIVLIAAIVAAAATVMAVPDLREPVFSFVTRTYSDHTDFKINPDDLDGTFPDKIETVYMPTAIPEGYKLQQRDIDELMADGFWQKSMDENIIFTQSPATESSIALNTEGTRLYPTQVRGRTGYTYTSLGSTTYLWPEYGYLFTLDVPESFTKEQTDAILNSIREYKKLNTSSAEK